MRMLVDINMPNEPFNTLVKNGTAGAAIQKALAEIKPEAIYFTERNGMRGCTMVVEMPAVSAIPSIAEPFFLMFDATVNLHPVMSPEDLSKAGLDELGKKYS